jgi:DNA polymerase-3 subunit delta'
VILHELTKQQVEALIKAPNHAILLVGPKGSGKRSIANHLISEIIQTSNIETHPYGKVIVSEDNKAIGIEAVRELEHFLSLKVPGSAATNRFIIFEDAHLLTHEAQNALLKTLEEPPQGSIIVMTASHEQSLLPTIRSRAQTIKVSKPSQDAVNDYFAGQGHDLDAIKRAAAISGGLPGLMHTLLSQEGHPLTQATDYARQLLSKTAYERLLMVDELAKNKALTLDICFILQQMAQVSLQKADGTASKKWQAIMQAAYEASEQLTQNAQPKLVLDNLMLGI